MSEQNQDMMALLQRMQQQLTYLEKKLDTLLQQSQPKPFSREGNFSRPPSRPPSRPFRPARPNGPGGHNSHGHGHSQSQGHFAPKKKPYFGQGRDRH